MLRWLAGSAFFFVSAFPVLADPVIKDIRGTYGPNGPDRAVMKCYPGDEAHFRYVVDGLKTDENGHINAEINLKLRNAAGRVLLSDKPASKGVLALGGSQLTGQSNVTLGADYPPGEYTLSVEVTDNLAKKSASFERKIEVQKPDFAIVALRFNLDPDRKVPAPRQLSTGQSLFFRFRVQGYDRSAKKLKLAMVVQTLDDKGKEQMPKPLRAEVATEDPDQVAQASSVTFNGSLTLNRPGAFKLKLLVEDLVNNKKLELEVPFKVAE